MNKTNTLQKSVLLGSGGVLFACVAFLIFNSLGMAGSPIFPILFIALIFVGACGLFCFTKYRQDDTVALLFQMAILAGLIIARFIMLSHESRDYQVFLSDWVAQIRNAEGFSALKMNIGDYNMPYLYLLFIISKLTDVDLYYIKLFSIVFDLLAAWFAARLVARKFPEQRTVFAAFATVLAVPTVLLNSAYWGQCDSVFTALGLGAILYGLEGRSRSAWLMIALAFSFKLQTIFFIPAFVLLVLLRRVRWQDCWVFPAAFFATLLPAIVAGKPIADTLSIYVKQTDSYPELVWNAPTVFRLFGTNGEFEIFNLVGIFLAGTACAAVFYLLWNRRDSLDDERIIEAAFLFALIIPFVLPRMHDRYFFPADVLSVVCFFYNKKRWYLPVAVIGASYGAYHYYLMGAGELFSPVIASVGLLAVIAESVARLLKVDKEIA